MPLKTEENEVLKPNKLENPFGIKCEGDFWNQVMVVNKPNMGADIIAAELIFDFVFDNLRTWEEVNGELNTKLYGGNVFEGLIIITASILTVYELRELDEKIKPWMQGRLTDFHSWVKFHLGEELKKYNLIEKHSLKNTEKAFTYNSLEQVAINPEKWAWMVEILVTKKAISPEYTLKGTATFLYSLIKQFKKLGHFKKITHIKLHLLVNDAFKMNETHQLYKQTDPYSKDLT